MGPDLPDLEKTVFILESGFIGVNLAGFLVDKFKRLKLVALCCVAMCKIFNYISIKNLYFD